MLETYPSPDALADAAADAVAACLAQGLASRGVASLVATGGRSPGPVYDRLRNADLDWAQVTVTLSDERCVDDDAPESNARLVQERLLQGPAARAVFLPLWPEPRARSLFALLPFDAVLLGMGEDGHIASLIPGSPSLLEGMAESSGKLTVEVPAGVGSPPLPRISLTLPTLTDARAIFLLIAGEAKREVIASARAGQDLPVRALLTQDRVPVRVLWAPEH